MQEEMVPIGWGDFSPWRTIIDLGPMSRILRSAVVGKIAPVGLGVSRSHSMASFRLFRLSHNTMLECYY